MKDGTVCKREPPFRCASIMWSLEGELERLGGEESPLLAGFEKRESGGGSTEQGEIAWGVI